MSETPVAEPGPEGPGFVVRAATAAEWATVRGARLAMLADPSAAFGHGPDAEAGLPEQHWRDVAAAWAEADQTLQVAEGSDGTWLGVMGCRVQGEGPELTWVWVVPAHRGPGGVTDALLTAVEHWAQPRGDALSLKVFTDVGRAVAAYRRRGFTAVGDPVPAREPGRADWVMRKPLR
ncbi:GNAT family N-acetyltransferase [Xylanimonas sp. McL0601]|uniref:GNAT family N-acetyltransferase n=1 Tax=Xylanimonas sp. McL0601 TaxID=3414739 RepID=UPI003CF00A8F